MRLFCIFSIAVFACTSHHIWAGDFDPFTVSIMKSAAERWNLDEEHEYLVLKAESDSSHFYLHISADKKIRNQFLPTYYGVEVLLCGEKNNPYFTYDSLFSISGNAAQQEDSLLYPEYPEWRICRHRDGSFCKMLTQLESPYDDIHWIEEIAKKNMNIGPEIQEDLDRIYPGFEVEKQAEYMFGRDSLSKITRKFPCYRGNRQEFTGISRYIVLNIVVNKNGNSEATKVEVSSGDINIDSLAVVYFNSMLKDSFYPAELRGEKVNSNISIVLPTRCPKQTKIDNGYGTIEERRVIAGMEQKVAKALGEINGFPRRTNPARRPF